jgi:hypothetical protein
MARPKKVVTEKEPEIKEAAVVAPAPIESDPAAPESLEAVKIRLEKELEENQAAQHQLRVEETEINGELDSVIRLLAGEDSPHSNQVNIMNYIQSQNRARAERAGVFIEEPAPIKAPIDRAFAGNRRRGLNRPQVPLKG